MIAMDNQPITISSDQGFIDLLTTLEPCYLIPSTKYITDTMLPQSYESLKLKKKLKYQKLSFCHVQVTYRPIQDKDVISLFYSLLVK